MSVELVTYSAEDLALTEALETDPAVMSELGGARPKEELAAAHRKRLLPMPDGDHWWFKIVPEPSGPPAGQIGIWESRWQDAAVYEVGWMLLPAYQGRGLASEALAVLLDRARAASRFDSIHAFPGVSNGPSNALCRKSGFQLLGESEVEFRDRPLRVNHWQLVLAG